MGVAPVAAPYKKKKVVCAERPSVVAGGAHGQAAPPGGIQPSTGPRCIPVPPPLPPVPPPQPPTPAAITPRQAPVPLSPTDPRDYNGYRQAPHPYVYWLAKRDVSVEAGENIDVDLTVDSKTGDKTYTVSSRISPSEERRIEELEREMIENIAEIRRIKANMLTVAEDEGMEGNGIVFSEGLEDGD